MDIWLVTCGATLLRLAERGEGGHSASCNLGGNGILGVLARCSTTTLVSKPRAMGCGARSKAFPIKPPVSRQVYFMGRVKSIGLVELLLLVLEVFFLIYRNVKCGLTVPADTARRANTFDILLA
jgi:hypothetical protein